MSLESHLRARREAGCKLLVPYVTGGLGSGWLDVVRAIAAAGADAIEIGIPFSDPVMDGLTIQEASRRALDLGATPSGVISDAAKLDDRRAARGDDLHQPGRPHGLPALRRRAARRRHRRRDPARPPARRARRRGPTPPMRTTSRPCCSPRPPRPTTVSSRSASARAASSTACRSWASPASGRRSPTQAAEMGRRLKAVTDKPVLLGIGISNAEQAVEAAQYADGVIVGQRADGARAERRRPRRRARVRGRAARRPRPGLSPAA